MEPLVSSNHFQHQFRSECAAQLACLTVPSYFDVEMEGTFQGINSIYRHLIHQVIYCGKQ
ncbi:hypothetical protein E2C01_018177 [Portunus trituberculatus]|uniref:Uncharacterized protein n=1 Tax=Portunus trituberculatus TaxID=210409 RepID=A0A5B7DUF2_PORTR|nr:hypothetical protein [Portunus trituberculatus]